MHILSIPFRRLIDFYQNALSPPNVTTRYRETKQQQQRVYMNRTFLKNEAYSRRAHSVKYCSKHRKVEMSKERFIKLETLLIDLLKYVKNMS